MDRDGIKDLIYGSMRELMRNHDYYYHSNVSESYSEWTPAGEKALIEHMNMMARLIKKAEHADLEARARQLVMDTIKGDAK